MFPVGFDPPIRRGQVRAVQGHEITQAVNEVSKLIQAGNTSEAIKGIDRLQQRGINLSTAYGYDISGKTFFEPTLLMVASAYGNREVCSHLLDRKNVDPKVHNRDGIDAYTHAAHTDQIEILELLRSKGVTFQNAKGYGTLSGPMLWAGTYGQFETVKHLEAQGDNIHGKTKEGHGLLHKAAGAMKDSPELVQYLIDSGLDVNGQGEGMQKGSPLIEATSSGNIESVKVLLKARADVNAEDSFGRTALSFTFQPHPSYGTAEVSKKPFPQRLEIKKLLLEAGANPAKEHEDGSFVFSTEATKIAAPGKAVAGLARLLGIAGLAQAIEAHPNVQLDTLSEQLLADSLKRAQERGVSNKDKGQEGSTK